MGHPHTLSDRAGACIDRHAIDEQPTSVIVGAVIIQQDLHVHFASLQAALGELAPPGGLIGARLRDVDPHRIQLLHGGQRAGL